MQDIVEHEVEMIEHISVGETDHSVAEGSKVLGSRYIVVALVSMDFTINLNHQVALRAAEVDDERTQWMLAAEL